MGTRHILTAACLLASAGHGLARATEAYPPAASRVVRGLNTAEADALLAKLADAQNQLKAGKRLSFQLLAGSIAFYEQTRISPRDAFLAIPVDAIWHVERVRTDNRLWQPYRLAWAPNGRGQLYWDIEMVLGINGNIERVQMMYRPPAP